MYLWKEMNNVEWNKVDYAPSSEVCPDLTLVQNSKQAMLSQLQAWLSLHRPRASGGDGTGSYSLWKMPSNNSVLEDICWLGYGK